MPGIINSFAGVVTSGLTLLDVTEPWGEAARQTSLTSGALELTGYDFTGLKIVEFHISGVTVTTDDSTVAIQFYINGSLITAAYAYSLAWRDAAANVNHTLSTSAASIMLTSTTATDGVGNASTEGFDATVVLYGPASTQHKRCFIRSSYLTPAGNVGGVVVGSGQLANASAITGIKVIGSSSLLSGSIIALAVE